MADTKINDMSGTKFAVLLGATLLLAMGAAEAIKYAWNQRQVGS